MPSIPEQADHVPLVRSLRSSLAQVLAYIEGATDERSAMSKKDEIEARYETLVQDEGWEPSFVKDAPK
ncbi:MAG: hypothetical protein ABWZ53_05260 [Actinomycetota bacterium]